LVVGDTVCADEFQGVIRKEDLRATEKDKVVLGASFVPGDVVRACVVRFFVRCAGIEGREGCKEVTGVWGWGADAQGCIDQFGRSE